MWSLPCLAWELRSGSRSWVLGDADTQAVAEFSGVAGAGLAPALVHWVHDQPVRGFRAAFLLPGLAITATVVVAVAAYGVFALVGAFPPAVKRTGII